MPIYQTKTTKIKAQQWNRAGEVPSWAYGQVKEFDDSFEIKLGGATLIGGRGDYIWQDAKGTIGFSKGEAFERNYSRIDDGEMTAEEIQDTHGLMTFHSAMRVRMGDKRREGRGGWWDSEQCSTDSLREMLMNAVAKGNMVDIANFSMMIYCRELQLEQYGKTA